MKTANKFSQLKAGDYLYFINPLNNKIESMPIKKIKVNSKSPHYIDITYYTLTSINEIDLDNTMVLDNLDTMTLAAPVGEDFCISMGKVPTAYCTDKGKLEEWMVQKK